MSRKKIKCLIDNLTDPFSNLESQDQEIGVISVVQERRATIFLSPGVEKGSVGYLRREEDELCCLDLFPDCICM